MVITAIGGVAIFLLGMILMTDGLKAIAGSALNRALRKLTRNPFIGFLFGATTTALVQSSSVVTLALIGFVGAGLLPFPNALGVIFGSNVGTTSTAWIVSQIGLKVNIGALAYPLVGIGTLLKLFGSKKGENIGSVLSGFGLIFIGISILQEGMSQIATQFTPQSFPGGSFGGNFLLLLIGIAMTVVMQSSSAAMATTLAALYGSAISLEQAAVLAIGQNIGTTVTALMASLGSTLSAYRTALAHIFFNVITAAIALLLLPTFITIMQTLRDVYLWDPTTILASFHTAFNCIGVFVLMPLISPFTKLMYFILPDKEPPLTRHLDARKIRVYSLGVEAARQAILDVARLLVDFANRAFCGTLRPRVALNLLNTANLALAETRRFITNINPNTSNEKDKAVSIFHAMDHLLQLSEELRLYELATVAKQSESVKDTFERVKDVFSRLYQYRDNNHLDEIAHFLKEFSLEVADRRRNQRRVVLEETARLSIHPDKALIELEAMRWLDRVTYHIWRAYHHLQPNSTNGKLGTDPEDLF